MTAIDLSSPSDSGRNQESGLWPCPPAGPQSGWSEPAALAAGKEQGFHPPLVFAAECDQLRSRLAAVARGEAFLIQGAVSADEFALEFTEAIDVALKTLLQMSSVLSYAMAVPVVRIGRIASSAFETREHRTAAAALNLARGLLRAGYADIALVHEWNRDFVATGGGRRYGPIVSEMGGALRFMAACGVNAAQWGAEFFAGREMSVPDDEGAPRSVGVLGEAHDGAFREEVHQASTHMVWVDRSDSASVELASRVSNPIGVRIGSSTTPDEVLALLEHLDPDRAPGRLTFLAGMGAESVRDVLPDLIGKVAASGALPVWVCDPLCRSAGRLDAACGEVRDFFEVHRELGTRPGGLCLDPTGGSAFLREQLLELAFSVAEMCPGMPRAAADAPAG
ncbi:hypothetical protein BLA24_33510 [Streptomyces cinnamoneus]|uniref:Phospho-2-dehydro-3-deoxyheptonate aldolase n=1 Tax=Streptomyces cinnamoneus TaxID=53446 RepID=A0A2G1XAR0_STRCJ|nr:3-deoxy-7-phosphoheptulonate synthase [Streptomyces cinnamoneus]PHQ48318.1 hypothetical protein BLA24_33510 [Streptomyces cinnamoneus]PPT15950.1 3-deoxy-7-phosphoheptulonate synthase class II [Streptomyces cinnamoneus]